MIVILSSIAGLVLIFGFSRNRDKEKTGGYVFIPQGSTEINGEIYSLDAYWISDHEISNKEYNTFLADLSSEGKVKEYELAKINTQNWITKSEKNFAPYAEYYAAHEAYSKYPVVNISYAAAKLYCEWLTEKSGDKSQLYRLPTKIEWIYAAKGGLDPAIYAWGGNSLKNNKGESMCNYRKIGDEFIHTDSDNNYSIINDYKKKKNSSSAPSPVDSYDANEYGLYNVCGNAAEMIDEKGVALGGSWNNTGYDVRVTSEQTYEGSNPFVGFRPVRVKKM